MQRRVWSCATVLAVLIAGVGCSGRREGVSESCIAIDDRAPTLCHAGRCQVSAAAGAIPVGQAIKVEEVTTPTLLAKDSTASFMCNLTVPETASAAVTLTLETKDVVPPRSILFRHDTHADVASSSIVTGASVHALVSRSGLYGLTIAPPDWGVEVNAPTDPLSSADTKSLLRNISLQSINAAFFDGKRLYVGDGSRVLIYDGIPANPSIKPSVVLGQPELDRIVPGTSASILNTVGAIWSDGEKLVVANGNRVLIWNRVPTTTFAPADLVLGQQDFVSSASNAGGVSASTLSSPRGIDSDGTRLLIADTLNNRVLAWEKFPTTIAQPATSVLGQPSLATNDVGLFYQSWGVKLDGPGALVASWYTGNFHFPSLSTFAQPDYSPLRIDGPPRVQSDAVPMPSSVTKTANGGLATFDTNARIAMHRVAPKDTTPMDFVLGQPDPTRIVEGLTSASTVSYAGRVIDANGLLLVPDTSRLLIYEKTPTYNFEPAQRVVGQAGFTTNDRGIDYRRISERTLGYPADVAVLGQAIAVADRGNNRVVLFKRTGLQNLNAPAAVVLGQPDAGSFVPNTDQVTATAKSLSGPAGVALTPNHLIVADTENHRVLIWTPVPTTTNEPATIVLGQKDFAGHLPNRGHGDVNGDGYSDASSDSLFYPTGVSSDGVHLFVADRLNNRVLVWNDISKISSGVAADGVLGQTDFSTVLPNRGAGGAGAYHPVVNGLNLPTGVTLAGTSLWVADTENNRLVRYDDVMTSPHPTLVLGQPDGGTLTNPNYYEQGSAIVGVRRKQPTTSSSVLRPRAVALSDALLYVSETDSNRVHVFGKNADQSYSIIGQLGQSDATTAIANAGGIGAGTLAAPLGMAVAGDRLYVADSANHRVVGYEGLTLPSTPRSATTVLGQTSFLGNGFNQSLAVTAGGSTRPRGLAVNNNEIFVAESNRHRVVVHELPLTPGKEPKRIIGQPDDSLSLPNGGGSPSASSLASPNGVYVDDERVIIADTGNHRVLMFSRTSSGAQVVLGQTSFDGSSANRGASATAATLAAPESAYFDGQRLFVADTGNHRVLVWNSLPKANGQAADVVLGQPDFLQHLTNGGQGTATASTMAFPSAVHAAKGMVFVADSGNNRVLVYSTLPAVGAALAATRVLGQADAQGRIPTADINDIAHLAGPVAITSDNANLYVADRDANRIVAYDLGTVKTGSQAIVIFNANNNFSAAGPAGLAVEQGSLFTSRLFVASGGTGNPNEPTYRDQLVVLGPVSRLR